LTEPAASDKLVSSSALKTDWNWWREKSKDLYFFCTVVLHDSWGDAKFGNFGILHKSLCSFLNPYENKNRRLFVSVFRGSFKTTVLLGLVVQMFCWAVANAEPISIVYNTATKDNAQAFMDDFRQTLRQNTLLQWIFPELPQIFEETVSKSRGPKYRRFTLEKVEFQDAKFHVASLDTKQVSRHYNCILPGIFVHTTNGIEKIEKVNVGNRVLGMNGKHNEIIAKNESLHKGKIAEIKLWGQPEPIKSTLDHRFLVWGSLGLKWKEAGEIKPGDYLATPLPNGLTRAYSRVNKRINKIMEQPDFWRFIGYWLAEGCASEGNRVRLTFGKHERGYADEVKSIIERITGRPVNIHPTASSTIMVDFADADVKEILDKFGTHSYNKHLPALALSLNPNRQREMIIGYFRGDGCCVTGSWGATSVSRALLEGMKIALAQNGIESSISTGAAPGLNTVMGNLVQTRQSYAIASRSPLMNVLMGTPAKFQVRPMRMLFIPGFMLEKVKKTNSYFYEGLVYDLQVRKSESFSVMGGLAHNCVINDDLVNDDNAFSEVERANILRKWRLQKSILTKYKKLNTGTEIDVGTPYDKSDLIAHIIREVVGYQKFIVPYAMKADDNKWYLTFPELYTWEDFKEKLSDMGESLFSTQYRLKVIDEASKIAKNILYWDVLPEVYNRYLIVDPAGSLNKKNDPTGFLVLDVDERGIYYVLHAEERWIDSYEILKYAEELSKRYKTDEVFFEKEKTSQSLAATVEHLFPKFNFTLTSHDNMPQEKRVIRLRQFFDTKRIFFGRVGQKKLETQVLHYPDVEHDDLIVCLAYGVKQAIPPKKGYVRDADDNERDFGDEISSLVARSEGNENMDAAY
jgi:hypothetical protein